MAYQRKTMPRPSEEDLLALRAAISWDELPAESALRLHEWLNISHRKEPRRYSGGGSRGPQPRCSYDEVVALHNLGLSNVVVATRVGVSRERVRQILKGLGVQVSGWVPCSTEGCNKRVQARRSKCGLCLLAEKKASRPKLPTHCACGRLRTHRNGECGTCRIRRRYHEESDSPAMMRRKQSIRRHYKEMLRGEKSISNPRNPERRALVHALSESGMSMKAIAMQIGCSAMTVAYHLKTKVAKKTME